MKLLVVNADDLGYDPEIDRGILEAHRRGIVRSASAMVDTPFAQAALRSAPRSLGVGLHAVLDPNAGAAEAERELRRQLGRFEALRGGVPTHLDSHRHAHASAAILEAFATVAKELSLPVRAIDPRMRDALRERGVLAADRFLGDAALRPAWTADALLATLATIEEGVSELMAHPGYRPSHARTSFGPERETELAALCDARAPAVLGGRGVRACSWTEASPHLARGRGPGAIVDRPGRQKP